MYLPQSFAEHDPAVVHAFIAANPLGTLVTAMPGLYATPLPFLLDAEQQLLEGHVARANPHHRDVPPGSDALVIFSGPDAYVTPEWYATKKESGKVVPTWNYVAVHVHGRVTFIDDVAYLRRMVESLTHRHEASRAQPWHVSDAPADYVENQLKAIVGVRLEITRIEGKWKMSQNRTSADVQGVADGLSAAPSAMERTVGEIVAARRR